MVTDACMQGLVMGVRRAFVSSSLKNKGETGAHCTTILCLIKGDQQVQIQYIGVHTLTS